MITVSKSSSLYKFYLFLSEIVFFNNLTPYYHGEINTFSDACTFLRTTLLYLFIGLPSLLLLPITFFVILISGISSLINWEVNPLFMSGFLTLVFIFTTTIFVLLIYSIYKLIGKIIEINKNKDKKNQTSSFLSLIKTSVVAKHEKVCKIIKVVD